MNRIATVSTLAVAFASLALSPVVLAQAAGPQVPANASAGAAAPVQPQAIPAKIALISFEAAVFSTNEGQKAIQDLQTKFQPQQAKIENEGKEVESLRKQIQSAPNLADAEKATRIRTIDTKEKQLQRDTEDARASYQQELQEVYARVAQKVNATMQKYVADNGFTILLDVSGQQSNVLFALPQTDVTRAVIDAYNTASGVAAPPPSAPAASAPAHAAPRATPRTATPRQ